MVFGMRLPNGPHGAISPKLKRRISADIFQIQTWPIRNKLDLPSGYAEQGDATPRTMGSGGLGLSRIFGFQSLTLFAFQKLLFIFVMADVPMTKPTLSAQKLFRNYQLLSQKEKESFDRLVESSKPVPEWQQEEVKKRMEALEANPNLVLSKEDAFRKLGWT